MTQIPNVPAMWADGTQLVLSIEAPAGLLYRQSLPAAVLTARLAGGEMMRFTYDLTDPETGEVTHGAARLLLQDMPDPRRAAPVDPSEPCGRCGKLSGAHHDDAQGHLWIRRMAYQDAPCAVCGGSPRAPQPDAPDTPYHRYVPAEVQPVPPAEATADACRKCGRTFREDGKFVDSAAQSFGLPYCQTCVGRCHDTEIADHWCEIDGYRTRADKAAPGSHSAPEPPRGA